MNGNGQTVFQVEDGSDSWNLKAAGALAILTLVYSLNYADRQIMGLVLPLIKKDLQLSDASLGLITGFVFVLFYSLLGVPIARLADRGSRRNILAVGLAFWSLMTFLTGAVTSVWQLAATRFLMGAGEATGVAPSTSMVADIFGPTRRPLALAILTSGAALAALIFFPMIGWIAQNCGWRTCFAWAGLLGGGVTLLLVAAVPEPRRAGLALGAKVTQEDFATTMQFLLSSRSYALTVLGGGFVGIGLYASLVWDPSFLSRVHHFDMLQIGTTVGLVRGLAGLTGTITGGLLTEYLSRYDDRWRLWLPGLACIGAMPCQLVFLLSPSTPVMLSGMLLGQLLISMQFGPVYAACQSLARPTMRATAIATFLLFANLMGQIIGPLAVGYLNDQWRAVLGSGAISYSLILGTACAAAGGGLLLLAARDWQRDTARAEVGYG